MDPERWERVKSVYHSARDRDASERAAFLEEACRDDPELRREVESLLAQASGDSFLERPAWQSATIEESETQAPLGPTRPHPFLWIVVTTTVCLAALFAYAAWQMPRDVPALGWTEARRGSAYQVLRVDPAGPAAGNCGPVTCLSASTEILTLPVSARSPTACFSKSGSATTSGSAGAPRLRSTS